MSENRNEELNMKKAIDFYNENNHVFDNFEKEKSITNQPKNEKSNSGKEFDLKLLILGELKKNISQSKIFNDDKNHLPRSESITRTSSKASKKIEAPKIKKENYFEELLEKIFNSITIKIIFGLFTIWSLFCNDIRILLTTKEADDAFSSITCIILGSFLLEFIYSCVYIKNYFLGFYFWLDIISLMSLVLDINWIYLLLIDSSATTVNTGKIKTNITKVTSALKVFRILRLTRVIRIMKLQKLKENIDEVMEKKILLKSLKHTKVNEMKISKKLNDLILRRVIVLVLSMILGIIVFNPSVYYNTVNSMEFGMKMFKNFENFSYEHIELTFDIYIHQHLIQNHREEELIEASEDCFSYLMGTDMHDYASCAGVFDNGIRLRLEALLNIIKTLFICLILSASSYFFIRDTNTLVIEPIDSIISKIRTISNNPMEALNAKEDRDYLKEKNEVPKKKKTCCEKKGDEVMETAVLDKTITKIASLLAMGLGENGSNILSRSLRNNLDQELNPMIEGRKTVAIYSYCGIKNFYEIFKVLKEDVLIFVNDLAEIVHDICDENFGLPDKNLGEAFSLIWSIEEEYTKENPVSNELEALKCNVVRQLSDAAVITILEILMEVYRTGKLAKYRKDESLLDAYEDIEIKLTFGLHMGWSIEGIFGSNFKIDTLYQSMNVKLSRFMQNLTNEYGVDFILTDKIVDNLSENAKKYVRPIDKINIVVDHKNIPLSNFYQQFLNFYFHLLSALYTIDLDLKKLAVQEEKDVEEVEMDKAQNYEKRDLKNNRYKKLIKNELQLWEEFELESESFLECRKTFTREFMETYRKGFDFYVSGDWQKSKDFLEQAQEMLEISDNPIHKLLEFLNEHNFIKPLDWTGAKIIYDFNY